MPEQKIRIAIVGGGLGGTCMAHALISKPHLDVHVFEAAPEFSERGAAVGLSHNAIDALEAIISSAREVVLDKAGAVPSHSSRVMLASGPHAGEKVFDIPTSEKNVIVHRAALLSALVAPLPKEALHVNKKLDSVKPEGSKLLVAFADGVTEIFDAVIGADGIFGSAKEKLGPEYFAEHRQYGWCGDGAFIMHDVLDNGERVQCVVSAVENEQPKDRSRPLTRKVLEETLKTWLDGPIAKSMMNLVLECPDLKTYSQWEHKSTPTYANGNVCIMGDAAHATTPWQGSGAAMAIEILQSSVRRPRCQRIIDSSKATGKLMCGQGPAADADADAMRSLMGERWDFIKNFDISEEMEKAVARLNELK